MNYEEQTLEEFLSGIASERVAPAGGTAAAVVGAIGTALCEMVCIHTVEKGEDTAVETELSNVRDDLQRQRSYLLQLAGTDASIIDELFSGLDGDMEQSEIKRLIGVPLTIADVCLNVLDLAIDVTGNGTPNAVPDAGTGVFLVHSILRASVFTVRSNVGEVSDPSFIAKIETDVAAIETRGDEAYEMAMENVEEQM